MTILYEYIHHLPHTEQHVTLPSISFTTTFTLTSISTLSIDVAEEVWKNESCLVFMLDNNQHTIYYVLLPEYMHEYISSTDYHRIILDYHYFVDRNINHVHNIYAIQSFLLRFDRRIRTRHYLTKIQSTIPYPTTELAYHQQFIEKVRICTFMNKYDLPLIRKYLYESLDIVNGEKEYRPDSEKVKELKQDFEELALLMKPIPSVSVHKYLG